jgi:leader peptidase (prepilin peptidase)/N-methyltransferase
MWHFEEKFIDKDEIEEGVLPEKYLLPLTLVLSALFISSIFLVQNLAFPYWVYIIIAIICSRLIAIDLRHFLLPDVYTLPLLIMGVIIPPLISDISFIDTVVGAVIGFAVPFSIAYGVYLWKGSTAGLGGGDIKLMAACGAWVGIMSLPLLIMLTCIISLIVSFFAFKNNHIPFGPGLCIALWLLLIFNNNIQNIINTLIL